MRNIHSILLPVGICLVGGVALFYQLGDARALSSHEAYVAVPVREMFATGDFIVPRFGGLPRLEKPPLGYWVAALSSIACGGLSEWALRLPSAIAAVLLAVLMGYWARRWYGSAAGWGAAMAQLTGAYVLIYARKAEVDMQLCLMTTAALFLVAQQPAEERGRRAFARWTGIYALISLAWMAKFHYGPTMVMAPTIVYLLMRRRFRSLRQLANPVGLALLWAAISVWPWLLLQQAPEAIELWSHETVGRAMGSLGRQPIWFFAFPTLWMVLPWTPYALAAARDSWKRAWIPESPARPSLGERIRLGDPREQFLWVWFVVVFVIVSLSASKHRHYIMAALPMFSLLAGQRISQLVGWYRDGRRLLSVRWAVPAIVLCAAGGIAAAVAGLRAVPELRVAVVTISAMGSLGACAILWLLASRRTLAAAYTAMVVFTGCCVGVNGWILPNDEQCRQFVAFARDVRAVEPDDQVILVYRMGYHSIVYYLDPPVARVESIADVNARLANGAPLRILTYEPYLSELAPLGEIRTLKDLPVEEPRNLLTRWPIHLVEMTPPRPPTSEPPAESSPSDSPSPSPRRLATSDSGPTTVR